MPTENKEIHTSVLLEECLDLLRPERGGVFVDATLGMGGHAAALLARAAECGEAIRLIGIDQDESALALAKQRLGERAEYFQGNFSQLSRALIQSDEQRADGILLDLGVSSLQIDTAARGFSFLEDGPLDMRMDQGGEITAADIVNTYPEPKLAEIFFRYGEERLSRKIARAICEDRQKERYATTKQLSDLLYRLYPPAIRHKKPHPATRVFQALRIEVNRELEVLEDGLAAVRGVLAPDGIVAVISFHSLEDRIVKHTFREWAAVGEGSLLTKKPILPSEEETAANPRSRSAKLRGFQRAALP